MTLVDRRVILDRNILPPMRCGGDTAARDNLTRWCTEELVGIDSVWYYTYKHRPIHKILVKCRKSKKTSRTLYSVSATQMQQPFWWIMKKADSRDSAKKTVFSRPYLVRSRLCDRLAYVCCLLSVCDVMYFG